MNTYSAMMSALGFIVSSMLEMRLFAKTSGLISRYMCSVAKNLRHRAVRTIFNGHFRVQKALSYPVSEHSSRSLRQSHSHAIPVRSQSVLCTKDIEWHPPLVLLRAGSL